MNAPIRTRRKNAFNVLKEAERMASFDEYPMLRPEVDPQIHVSRNTVDQPFGLVCEKDCVIAQVTGSSRIEFEDGPVRYFDTTAGDFVYIPASTQHRLRTVKPGTVMRYKAKTPGCETAVLTCSHCDAELFRHAFDASTQPAQRGYWDACAAFNADHGKRTCQACGEVNAEIDLAPFRWAEIASKLSSDND